MGLEEKQGLVGLGRDLGGHQRLGSPLLWGAMVCLVAATSQPGASWELWRAWPGVN